MGNDWLCEDHTEGIVTSQPLGGEILTIKLSVQELRFIRECLRKSMIGRSEADKLWAVMQKLDKIIEEAKNARKSA